MRRMLGWLLCMLLLAAAFPPLRAASAQGEVAAAPAWYWTHPLPNGNQVNDLVYAQGKYVAAGANGTIMTSVDADSWRSLTVGPNVSLNRLAYGQGRFVAVGDGALLVTSIDGENWSELACEQPPCIPKGEMGVPQRLNGVVFGSGRFVAVGGYGLIIASADGLAWTRQAPEEPEITLVGVAFSGSEFLAVGYETAPSRITTFTSRDGVKWSRRDPNLSFALASELSYANGRYVIGGSGAIATSTDGLTWQEQRLPESKSRGAALVRSVAYGKGQYVLVGEFESQSGALTPVLYTSADGLAWQEESGFQAQSVGRALFYQDRFFVTGTPLLASRNGRLWWPLTPGYALSHEVMSAAGFENGRFVVAGEQGTIMSSPDGICWTGQTLSEYNWRTVAFGNGKTVIGGGPHGMAFSTAAGDWQIGPSPMAYVDRIRFGNSHFVAAGTASSGESALYSSVDGTTWTKRWSESEPRLTGLYFVNNQFVAIGEGRAGDGRTTWSLGFSADGERWTWRTTSASLDAWRGQLFWLGGEYVLVGNSVLTSRDGAQWQNRLFVPADLIDSALGDGKIAILTREAWGNRPDYRVVAPGTWQFAEQSPVPMVPKAIAYGNGRYLVTGENGGIVVSAAPAGSAIGVGSRFTAGCRLYSHNGRPEAMPAYALERSGELMVPAVSLAGALGLPGSAVVWDASAKSLRLSASGKVITLVADQSEMLVDATRQPLPVPAHFGYGHLFVPVTPVVQALGYRVTSDPQSRSVLITGAP